MLFIYAGDTYDTQRASLFLVRFVGADHLGSLYVTPVSRGFGLVSCVGDDLEREFEVVPCDTTADVAEAWADDVLLSSGEGKGHVDTVVGTETV
ncbi:MAG: hypothetical protein K0S35_1320 [Geminicoccaceae bacterium]|nr:hypothetical protein [Geminicoccaceae bacterium]